MELTAYRGSKTPAQSDTLAAQSLQIAQETRNPKPHACLQIRLPTSDPLGIVPAMGTNLPVTVSVDATAEGTPLRHVWSWYGYDECNYTTSPSGRSLISDLAAINSEQVYLRAHHLLTSGVGTPSLKWSSTNAYIEDAAGRPLYSWKILDGIMDAVVDAGALPYVEVAFMPEALSSKPVPYIAETFDKIGAGASYPPKDYKKWYDLVRAWALHSKERYPDVEKRWIWELWNEPDIIYWRGSVADYCRLYDYTEAAIHDVMPNAIVGGPDGDLSYRDLADRTASAAGTPSPARKARAWTS